MERNLVERGYAGADELSAGHALRGGKPLARKLTPDLVKDGKQGMTRGSFYRQAQAPARFQPGERVRGNPVWGGRREVVWGPSPARCWEGGGAPRPGGYSGAT